MIGSKISLGPNTRFYPGLQQLKIELNTLESASSGKKALIFVNKQRVVIRILLGYSYSLTNWETAESIFIPE